MTGIRALLQLLPLLSAWGGCYGLCREWAARGRIDTDRRVSFLGACASWGVFLVFVTELCSLFRALDRPTLLSVWVGLSGILWSAFALLARQRRTPLGRALTDLFPQSPLVSSMAMWPVEVRLMAMAAVLLIMASAGIAMLTPTMNWDSLTYHLPRVMHWVQQGSVRHYPTACISQLQMGPWPAFVQTHLFLLWGSDQLANMVQWAAMAGCALLVPWIALQLAPASVKDSCRLQVFAALLVVTLPTGLVEGITPQTDYVTAFWFICLLGVCLDWMKHPSSLTHLFAAGCVGGLGLLTKVTTVFWVLPFGLAGGLWFARQWRTPGKITGRFLVAGVVSLAIVLPHFVRNFSLYGSPAGAQSSQQSAMNSPLSASGALSNLIRNAALHINTGIAPLTRGLGRGLAALHRLTGRSLQDPATTLYPDSFAFPREFKINDNETGNPYHAALILSAVVIIALRPGRHGRLAVCTALLLAGMALFCFLLRWQPWHSRYQLPFFVGFMPVVAVALAWRWSRWALNAVASLVTAFAVVVVSNNETRPVFNPAYLAQSRAGKMLFGYGPLYQENLNSFAGDIIRSGCNEVGLKLNSDDAEYPLWASLREQKFAGRIESVYVDNESARLAPDGLEPCVLFTMTDRPLPAASGQRWPFCTQYGQITACWSERASHWRVLTWFDTESQTLTEISPRPIAIPFRHRLITFYFRSPRAGYLRLTATAVSSQETPITNNILRAGVAAAEQQVPLQDGKVAVAVPLPAGESRLSLALIQPLETKTADARLADLQWRFDPAPRWNSAEIP